MKTTDLLNQITHEQIMTVVKSLGGKVYDEDDEQIILNTFCHGGDSVNKLYYYKDSKRFFCYSECGSLSLFDIIKNVKDYEHLYDAIDYVCTLLGISDMKEGFTDESIEVITDWNFINKFKLKKSKKCEKLKIYNKSILNIFQLIYHSDWINDGIDKNVMRAFDISYSTLEQKIIIPHFNIKHELLGVRARSMIEQDILEFGKYTPFQIGSNIMYNHKLSKNLYGIHINKDTIKCKKKVMLVEGEKSVLQCATMFGLNENFTLALCGSSGISDEQIKLLLDLGVSDVILALDRQFKSIGDEEYQKWATKIRKKFLNKLIPYFNVYVIWDMNNMLDYKNSPTDKGKDVLIELMKNKIYIKN